MLFSEEILKIEQIETVFFVFEWTSQDTSSTFAFLRSFIWVVLWRSDNFAIQNFDEQKPYLLSKLLGTFLLVVNKISL